MDVPTLLSQKRANPSCDNYVFISYAHMDADAVYADLNKLNSKHLNFWYDKELHVGDKWDEVVKQVLISENCRGVLFYLTPYSLMSEACEKEIKTSFERMNKDPSFSIILVSPYGKSVLETIRDIFLINKDLNGKQLEQTFPQERLQTITKYLTKNILYVTPSLEDEMSHINSICKRFKDQHLPVFSDDESLLDSLKEQLNITNIDGEYILDFGHYPQKKSEAPYPLREGKCTFGEKNYFTLKRISYLYEPISWYLLRLDGHKMTLVPTTALTYIRYSQIDSFFNEFKEDAFQKNASSIIEIRIPNQEDVIQIKRLMPQEFKISEMASSIPDSIIGSKTLFINENDSTVLLNRNYLKLNVSVKNNNFGYILPIVTIDVSKINK